MPWAKPSTSSAGSVNRFMHDDYALYLLLLVPVPAWPPAPVPALYYGDVHISRDVQ